MVKFHVLQKAKVTILLMAGLSAVPSFASGCPSRVLLSGQRAPISLPVEKIDYSCFTSDPQRCLTSWRNYINKQVIVQLYESGNMVQEFVLTIDRLEDLAKDDFALLDPKRKIQTLAKDLHSAAKSANTHFSGWALLRNNRADQTEVLTTPIRRISDANSAETLRVDFNSADKKAIDAGFDARFITMFFLAVHQQNVPPRTGDIDLVHRLYDGPGGLNLPRSEGGGLSFFMISPDSESGEPFVFQYLPYVDYAQLLYPPG